MPRLRDRSVRRHGAPTQIDSKSGLLPSWTLPPTQTSALVIVKVCAREGMHQSRGETNRSPVYSLHRLRHRCKRVRRSWCKGAHAKACIRVARNPTPLPRTLPVGDILARQLLATSWQPSQSGSNQTHYVKALAALR